MIPPWRNDKFRRAYNKPEVKASLEVILSVFASVMMVAVAIRPTLGTIATLQKKIKDSEEVDKKMDTKIASLTKAQQDLNDFGARLEQYATAIPDTHEITRLEQSIELLANEKGLRVNSVDIGAVPILGDRIGFLGAKAASEQIPPLEKGTSIAKLNISFEVAGDQLKIIEFLNAVENIDRVVLLNDITITKDQRRDVRDGSTTATIKAVGKADVYYLLATQEQGK